MYSSTLVLTSALDGVGGQSHAYAALLSQKTRYPLYSRLDESGRCGKYRPPPGSHPRTVQPVVSYAVGSFTGIYRSFRLFV